MGTMAPASDDPPSTEDVREAAEGPGETVERHARADGRRLGNTRLTQIFDKLMCVVTN